MLPTFGSSSRYASNIQQNMSSDYQPDYSPNFASDFSSYQKNLSDTLLDYTKAYGDILNPAKLNENNLSKKSFTSKNANNSK